MASRAFSLLRPAPHIFSDWFMSRIAKIFSRNLRKLAKELQKGIEDEATQEFLEILLKSMEVAFIVSKNYRKNIKSYQKGIKDFEGRYIFDFMGGENNEKSIITAVIFKNGKMSVSENNMENWDVKVTFRSADALNRFIFSRNQDIINSMLKNDVAVYGNLNYVYRFGFLAKDLIRRFDIL